MHIVLTYRGAPGGALTLDVPELRGMTGPQVADAAYAVTHTPPCNDYGLSGATAIGAAYFRRPPGRQILAPLQVGDLVHAAGMVLRLVAEKTGETNVWGRHSPVFATIEGTGPAGEPLHVSSRVAPPDEIAYAEDARDRLWTGKGAGVWSCLTDPAGRTAPVSWRKVWLDHGPLRPLAPVPVSSVCAGCGGDGGGRCAVCTRPGSQVYDPGLSGYPAVSSATSSAYASVGVVPPRTSVPARPDVRSAG